MKQLKGLAVLLLALLPIGLTAQGSHLEYDLTNQSEKTIDLSGHANMKSLKLTGAEGVILPNVNHKDFTFDATGSPNLEVDMGDQTHIETLTLINHNQIDISGCRALKTLTCQGTEWGDLSEGHLGLICNTGATETNPTLPALLHVDVSGSGVMKIDLTNAGLSMERINLFNSLTKELYVPNHLGLTTFNANPNTTYTDRAGAFSLGYSSITPQYYSGSWLDNIPTNRLEILDISGCSNITGSLLFSISNYGNFNMSPLRKLYAQGCSNIVTIQVFNSYLDELDVRNCTNLQRILVDQSYLKTVNLDGCNNVVTFNAKRCQIEDCDFLTKPVGTRTAAGIAKLSSIQLNGGAYSTQIYDAETGGSKLIVPEVYTNKIRNFDTQYMGASLEKLLIADNLLQTLNIHEGMTGLKELECENNMLLTLDLTKLPNPQQLTSGSWGTDLSKDKMQVGFMNVEVIKGAAEDGSQDWIAMELVNGGFTHDLDNNLKLYPSILDAKSGTNEIAQEGNENEHPHMATVEQFNERFNYNSVCPAGHTNEHLFLHSWDAIKNDNDGKIADQDLYGKVMTYKYDTGYNHAAGSNQGNPYTNNGKTFDNHIVIRVHLYPYVLNINSATKETENNTTGTDYYSSTLMLDYDAVIPEGVTVHVVKGFKEGFQEANQPNDPYDAQLVLQQIGGPGEVLPANTPVIVKSTSSAGLYAFQSTLEFDYKGWEDYRNDIIKEAVAAENNVSVEELIPILHGLDEDNVVYKTDYDPITYPEKWVNLKDGGAYDDAIKHNLLKGTLVDMPVASKSILTLGRQKNATSIDPVTGEKYASNKLGFWKYKATSLAAHRCYISVDDMREALRNAGMNEAKEGGAFFFDDNDTGNDDTTGISTINVNVSKPMVYDLQGRRITSQPTPGIYIVNGKKIIVR